MLDNPLASADKPQASPEEKSEGLVDWLGDNVGKPFANSLAVEPWNVAVNVIGKPVNAASQAIAHVDLVSKSSHLEVRPAEFLTPSWFVQTASGGLGAVIPYALAGKGAGSLMRSAGARAEATGMTATFLKSETAAQVVGAAAFDGLRDTRAGETHFGNAAGGAAGFFVFGRGNEFAKRFHLSAQLPLQAITGAIGGPVQQSVSRFIATGELPTKQELVESSVSGGFMNTALPHMQRGIVTAADRASRGLGFGVPIERYAENKFGARSENAADNAFASPTFKSTINDSWARVQEQPGQLNFSPKSNLVRIADNAGPEKLGHEAIHSTVASRLRAGYDQVGVLVQGGKNNQAWDAYRALRLESEARAIKGESDILVETGKRATAESAGAVEALVPSLKVADGRTYEQVWRADFEKAVASKVGFVPEVEFGNQASYDRNSAKGRSTGEWSQIARGWSGLNAAEKVSGLNGISFAPAWAKGEIFRNGLKDAAPQIRLLTAQSLHHLDAGKRGEAWRLMAHSDDHFVRQISLNSIKDLPANEREYAWRHALNFKLTLQTPESDPTNSYETSKYVNKLVAPEFLDKATRELVQKSPEDLFVASLAHMARGSRFELWQQAFQEKRTSDAAVRNLSVLPEADITAAWQLAWGRTGKGHSQDVIRDEVVKQIALLPRHDRGEALEKVIAVRSPLSSDAAVAAFKSVPEEFRTDLWNKMLENSKPLPEISSSLGGTTGFYRPRRSWWEAETVQKGLGGAIETLPLGERSRAWQEIANLDAKVYGSQLIYAIEHLPAADRLAATKHAIENFPTQGSLFSAVASVPGKHFPEVIEAIMAKTTGDTRQKLLEDFPTYAHSDLPLADKAAWMESTFKTAIAHAQPADIPAIRQWWGKLPEFFDEKSTQEYIPQLVKEQLTAKLDVAQLSKLVFHAEDQAVADLMVARHPEVIREIAKNAEEMPMQHESRHLAKVAQQWYESGNLLETIKVAASPEYGPNDWYSNHGPVPAFLDKVIGNQSRAEKMQSIETLRDMVLSERAHVSDNSSTPSPQLQLAFVIARRLASGDDAMLESTFLKPIQNAMFDTHRDYSWRLATTRDVAALQRSTMFDEANSIAIPDLRMPKIVGLSDAERAVLRKETESALREPTTALYKLMGDGALGKLFPAIFGDHETAGGMVGRPQHGGHEYPLHAHTLLVVKHTMEHPDFNRLSPKDQTNVLWAALLHDVGKRAAKSDPDHEWASANMSWGVLRTLGYSPVRTQRIASLISRHREMSFDPTTKTSEKMAGDSDYQYDLSTFYRNPNAIAQLQIFNEADIKSINATSNLWQPNVARELHEIGRITRETAKGLNQNLVPILTSEVPDRFGIHSMKGDYALLGHYSHELGDNFLKQLALIESPEYSISASLVTPTSKQFYQSKPDLVALVAAPPEHVSQAYRDNLGTGTSIAWKGHVKLARDWMDSNKGNLFAAQIDRNARMLGTKSAGGKFGSLATHRKRVLGFDSLDELRSEVGPNSSIMQTQKAITEAFTHEENGAPIAKHNEIKLNNPTVVGFGVLRRNRQVLFENADPAFIKDRLTENGELPKWLITDNSSNMHTLKIAESIWKAAVERDLPFVILDP
ncbi:MAG: hypothetical protein IAF58_09255 [Leptolyngbya sp.]|nr:hypothetical protein [Candidatus Melainabacteria bacterium]